MKALLLALAACACPQATPSAGGKPAVDPLTAAPTCASVRVRIEQLYRADAQQNEPKRVDEATADNTEMVMRHCTPQLAGCLDRAPTVADVEHCLPALDAEGSEGDRL